MKEKSKNWKTQLRFQYQFTSLISCKTATGPHFAMHNYTYTAYVSTIQPKAHKAHNFSLLSTLVNLHAAPYIHVTCHPLPSLPPATINTPRLPPFSSSTKHTSILFHINEMATKMRARVPLLLLLGIVFLASVSVTLGALAYWEQDSPCHGKCLQSCEKEDQDDRRQACEARCEMVRGDRGAGRCREREDDEDEDEKQQQRPGRREDWGRRRQWGSEEEQEDEQQQPWRRPGERPRGQQQEQRQEQERRRRQEQEQEGRRGTHGRQEWDQDEEEDEDEEDKRRQQWRFPGQQRPRGQQQDQKHEQERRRRRQEQEREGQRGKHGRREWDQDEDEDEDEEDERRQPRGQRSEEQERHGSNERRWRREEDEDDEEEWRGSRRRHDPEERERVREREERERREERQREERHRRHEKEEQQQEREEGQGSQSSRNNPFHFPRRKFRTRYQNQHGRIRVMQRFDQRSSRFQNLQKYRVVEIESRPNTLVLPKHADAESILVVQQGNSVITRINYSIHG